MIEFFRKQITMLSCHFAPKSTNTIVLGLVADGKLKPIIARKFLLHEMREAHELLASREFYGKIVLEV